MPAHHCPKTPEPTPWIGKILNLFSALNDGNCTLGASHLQNLIDLEKHQPYPVPFLKLLKKSLHKNDWSLLSRPFVMKEFVGDRGEFLWVAPYRFSGEGTPRLIGIAGRVIALPALDEESLEKHVNDLVCDSFRVPEVLPIEIRFSFGPAPELDQEVLLRPHNWLIRGARIGPALEQIRVRESAFQQGIIPAIQRLLLDDPANTMLSWTESPQEMRVTLFFLERFREVARAISVKEPERSDPITLELIRRSLDRSTASKVAAAFLCARLSGIKGIRAGIGSQSCDLPRS